MKAKSGYFSTFCRGGVCGVSEGLMLAMLAIVLAIPASAGDAGFKGVSAQIVVKSDPQRIFEAIRELRHQGKVSVTVLSSEGNTDTLEEKWDDLPIIGHAFCRYRETYVPFERIEYKMIDSDHFKAFEGRWTLTRQNDGSTLVALSSYVQTDLNVPFGHQLTNFTTMRNIHKRLDEVKRLCERRPG